MRKKGSVISFILTLSLLSALPCMAYGAEETQIKTKIKHTVKAEGEYENWEGVSNVSQFIGNDGEFWFAYNGKENVTVVSTVEGKIRDKLKLKKQHGSFGAVCSDDSGNFYLVTGEENKGDNTDQETVFITKYDSAGNPVKTVGNCGDSSISDHYGSCYRTMTPFDAGNCDVDINGGYLAVNYARTMYNGHQSNSVWVVDTESMNTIRPPEEVFYIPVFDDGVYFTESTDIYNSHSFGQRTVRYGDGFLFMSEGDAYERAFSLCRWDLKRKTVSQDDIFHFWIKPGSSDDMYVVNNNFAHIGDIAVLSDGKAAFTATSVPSMTADAEKESEQLFIQIFDPAGDLNTAEGYVTTGERSGTTGIDGLKEAQDHGVKWLTEDKKFLYRHPQMVSTGDRLVILYEKCAKKTGKLKGVFYMVLDPSGNVISESKKFKPNASLNPCETPVYTKGSIYWVSNKSSRKGKMFVYRIKLD